MISGANRGPKRQGRSSELEPTKDHELRSRTGSEDFRGRTGKMKFKIIKFASWDEFKNGIRGALPGSHDYDVYKRFIFRGQENADWPLKSSFDRTYSNQQAASRDTIAKTLIKKFFEECERYSPWRYSVNDPRVLAMAQHTC
jgi:FRG domain-containing protein